ncbi:MAG: hypothetical protein KGI25_01755 [Thaumarchaeota archaeon]|nr:hypothetical protein [Nitrososphaerota archaeon]
MRVDVKSGIIHGSKYNIPLRIGSRIISRVSAISMGKDRSMKVGLTCNEPSLGA